MVGGSCDPLSARRNDRRRQRGTWGLKPADFDAMTAAAWIECGDFGKVNEHEGLGFRSVPAGWQAGV